MDDMIPNDAAQLVPAPLCGLHLRMGGFCLAVDPGHKLVGFLRVFGIGQGIVKARLFLVEYIVHTMIHAPVEDDDLVIGHLQGLLYQPGGLPDKGGGLLDLRLRHALSGVGPISDLIDIVADGGQLTQ